MSLWPDSAAAAVSLTFDDGARSQLDNAVPCLDKAGLRGTFYLNPHRGRWDQDADEWRGVADTGHELGNHTTRHPCSCNYGFDQQFCLEKLTLQDLAETIDEAQRSLDQLDPDGSEQRSFCYPCYQTFVGTGTERRSYVPVVAERFRAARAGGERPNNPLVTDLHCLMSFAAEESSAERLIGYAESAADSGAWAIFTFHGVGGDHLAVSNEAFSQLVDHLAAHRKWLWTAPLIEVADHVHEARKA